MYAQLINKREEIVNFRFVTRLTFQVDNVDLPNELPDHCEITISEYSPDRNLPQNAKYWKIVGEIARKTSQSKTVIHNQLLNDYGEMELADGNPIPIVMSESYDYLEDPDLHLTPSGKTITLDGERYVIYYKLKNSASMTKKQFARLLEGAIYENESV